MPQHFLPGGYPNPDPYYISPEEERALEAANECDCDHGRVLVFRCKGHCECGLCPEVDDCPKCVGQIGVDEDEPCRTI